MALFNAIPYNYLPTASRLKNSIPRHESTQKKFTPNDTAVVAAADDEGYKPTFSEIDSVGHRDHNLESPIVENLQYTILKKNIESKNSILKSTIRQNRTFLGTADNCFASKENILARLFHRKISMERLQNSRGTLSQDRCMQKRLA